MRMKRLKRIDWMWIFLMSFAGIAAGAMFIVVEFRSTVRPLEVSATDCEIRSKNGELMNDHLETIAASGEDKIVLEPGSTISESCFQ